MKKLRNYLYLSILLFGTFTACQASEEQETEKEKKFILLNVYDKNNTSDYYYFFDMKISTTSLKKKLNKKLEGEMGYYFVKSGETEFRYEVTKDNLAEIDDVEKATIFTKKELEGVLEKIKDNNESELKDPYNKLISLESNEYMEWLKKNKNEKIVFIKKEKDKVRDYSIDEFFDLKDVSANDIASDDKQKEEQERPRQLAAQQKANKEKEFILLYAYDPPSCYFFVDRKISYAFLQEKLGEDFDWYLVESGKNKFGSEFEQGNLAEINNIHEDTLFTKEELEDMLKKIKDKKRKSSARYQALKKLQNKECTSWLRENKNERMVLIKEGQKLKEYTIAQFLGTNDDSGKNNGNNNGLGRKNEAKNGLGINDGDSSNNKSSIPMEIGGAIVVVFIVISLGLLFVSKSGSKKTKSQKKAKGTKKKANDTSKQ